MSAREHEWLDHVRVGRHHDPPVADRNEGGVVHRCGPRHGAIDQQLFDQPPH
jgi:hypothetical protein